MSLLNKNLERGKGGKSETVHNHLRNIGQKSGPQAKKSGLQAKNQDCLFENQQQLFAEGRK